MNYKLFIYIFALFVICTPKFLFKKNFMLQDLLYSAIFSLLFFLTYNLVESIQKEGLDDYKIKVDGANYLSRFLKSFSNDNDDPVKISINNKIEGPVKETIYRDITPLVESQPAPEPAPELSTPSLLSNIFTPSPEPSPEPELEYYTITGTLIDSNDLIKTFGDQPFVRLDFNTTPVVSTGYKLPVSDTYSTDVFASNVLKIRINEMEFNEINSIGYQTMGKNNFFGIRIELKNYNTALEVKAALSKNISSGSDITMKVYAPEPES